MKNFILTLFCLVGICCLSGCGLMEDAFKAGVIFALIIVAIVGLLIWLLRLTVREVKKYYTIEMEN